MGKEESTKSSDETESNPDASTPEITSEPKTDEEPVQENKQDLDSIRKVIKINEDDTAADEKKEEVIESEKREEEEPAQEKTEEAPREKTDTDVSKAPRSPMPAASPGGSKEDLEQRRNILQNIKDFDFQIKKNQEDIGKLVEKIDGVTKDLDDLVSLYEIVSEQMNPFVGLSKVTKKRIDALENFTQEIEDIKTRMGDLESVFEKNIGGLQLKLKNITASATEKRTEKTGDIPSEGIVEPEPKFDKPTVTAEVAASGSLTSNDTYNNTGDFSDEDLDTILSRSFEALLAEQNIDTMINEFLLNLK